MKKMMLFLTAFSGILSTHAHAKFMVVTTTPDLASLVREVGGTEVAVESISKGSQDPHFIEAKPSYMVKLNRADLVISVGLDLEVGWLPGILRGARNPRVIPGGKGYLEVGPLASPLEVATGKVTRAEGDVHPLGNPHVNLDPIRMGGIALKIAERLSELEPARAGEFEKNAKAFQTRMEAKTRIWGDRIAKSGVQEVVTYHRTLSYFLERFGLRHAGELEPKPGIPPTSGHIIEIIELIRKRKIPLILVENYFDPTVTIKIRQAVPGVRSVVVPVAVEGESGTSTTDELIERLVAAIEGK